MSGLVLNTGSTTYCPHGGLASAISTNTRVFASGQPIVTVSDNFIISGCVFTLPTGTFHPCISIKWLSVSLRIKINGQPAILSNSSGICTSADQSPQGAPNTILTQIRVRGV